jgi:hypothetical protein
MRTEADTEMSSAAHQASRDPGSSSGDCPSEAESLRRVLGLLRTRPALFLAIMAIGEIVGMLASAVVLYASLSYLLLGFIDFAVFLGFDHFRELLTHSRLSLLLLTSVGLVVVLASRAVVRPVTTTALFTVARCLEERRSVGFASAWSAGVYAWPRQLLARLPHWTIKMAALFGMAVFAAWFLDRRGTGASRRELLRNTAGLFVLIPSLLVVMEGAGWLVGAFLTPVVAIERVGPFRSIVRSFRATRGRRLRILFANLLARALGMLCAIGGLLVIGLLFHLLGYEAILSMTLLAPFLGLAFFSPTVRILDLVFGLISTPITPTDVPWGSAEERTNPRKSSREHDHQV